MFAVHFCAGSQTGCRGEKVLGERPAAIVVMPPPVEPLKSLEGWKPEASLVSGEFHSPKLPLYSPSGDDDDVDGGVDHGGGSNWAPSIGQSKCRSGPMEALELLASHPQSLGSLERDRARETSERVTTDNLTRIHLT